ncbi:Lrp/AsnC ligand binding domain-containing protein [Salarchaeum sp. III]|uniref:Lrp/AsnC ligand binding domain-containing protein n=1 Tax=Salarchaeum sp. III TaxID=3107927 RepID=UPI002EDAFC0C
MVHAFIMVKTAAGSSADARDAILDLAFVVDAHVVAGEYDVIVEADGDAVGDVLGTASTDIQGLEGVEDTKTYVSMSA